MSCRPGYLTVQSVFKKRRNSWRLALSTHLPVISTLVHGKRKETGFFPFRFVCCRQSCGLSAASAYRLVLFNRLNCDFSFQRKAPSIFRRRQVRPIMGSLLFPNSGIWVFPPPITWFYLRLDGPQAGKNLLYRCLPIPVRLSANFRTLQRVLSSEVWCKASDNSRSFFPALFFADVSPARFVVKVRHAQTPRIVFAPLQQLLPV